MSVKSTRKSQTATVVSEEKEKSESPIKEMKKKLAANAEKEKAAAEKVEKPAEKNDRTSEKPEKSSEKPEKPTEKPDKNEKTSAEKSDKAEKAEKKIDKVEKKIDKVEKKTDKVEKEKKPEKVDKSAAEKKTEKTAEKKEQTKEDNKADGKQNKEKPGKPVNGTHNGEAANGEDANGTVSDGSEDDLVIIEEDEVFPELTYDDSDTDAFDAEAPSRSLTRRSQVKVTKTPETPGPASEKEKEGEDSKESKLLKLKEDAATPAVTSDRKLRSADSPKPDSKKVQDTPNKQDGQDEEKKENVEVDTQKASKDVNERDEKLEMDVIIEVETTEGLVTPRTRARVSPYTRTRHDQTVTSVMADYTGNNSTMEMDISESSPGAEADDSGYLRGLRAIRGRASYKPLRDSPLLTARPRPPPALPTSVGRPTGAVVGRKRKPSDCAPEEPGAGGGAAEGVELGVEATDDVFAAHGKRMKLLDRLAMPFRGNIGRRAAEIVGINTDLPLSAPVASTSTFDPETIKPAPAPHAPHAPHASHASPVAVHERDGKRCVVM